MSYLDHERVTKYIALEPNTHMHAELRKVAHEAGYAEEDQTLVILGCGAEDTETILSAHGGQQFDTIISVLTLCTVPSPEQTISSLVHDVLKPGGEFLFYEHVLNPLQDVAWWQRFWAPFWAVVFDGCRIDRPTHLWFKNLRNQDGETVWKPESKGWGKEAEPQVNLFWHQVGRYVKN